MPSKQNTPFHQGTAIKWSNLNLDEQDIEFLYNWLLEQEKPQSISIITEAFVEYKIDELIANAQKQNAALKLYHPEDDPEIGDELTFSAFDMEVGTIVDKRAGTNPTAGDFSVVKVEFKSGETHEFAANLPEHLLNLVGTIDENDPAFDKENVLSTMGETITRNIAKAMEASESFATIAELWFPEALLIDINTGHLNLAEAVLDFTSDDPISTAEILSQIGLVEQNRELLEFSLNIALRDDPRFDEVGPSGEVLWFLTAREPKEINIQPEILKTSFLTNAESVHIDDQLTLFEGTIADEFEMKMTENGSLDKLTFSLIFPHWYAGTLPLSPSLREFFPTSIETPHIRFVFIDGKTKEKFPGWVVKPFNYVSGLQGWYKKLGLLPGSLIHLYKGKNPGEVIIQTDKKRASREWIRVAKFNQDGLISFDMQMELITAGYNDRMMIGVNDVDAVIKHWINTPTPQYLEKSIHHLMRELMKLNPQGHVHGQELYAAANLMMRCPPRTILNLLHEANWVENTGDLYFSLVDTTKDA
jgi:hypothetical protein